MTGTFRPAMLAAVAAVASAVAWAAGDLLVLPNGMPAATFTLGLVAAWIVVMRRESMPGVAVIIAVILALDLVTGASIPAAALEALAVLTGGVALGLLLIAARVTMRRPVDPAVVALAAVAASVTMATGQLLQGPQAVQPRPAWAWAWSAAAYGCVLVLPAVMTAPDWRKVHRPLEFVILLCAAAGLTAVAGGEWFTENNVGFLSWIALPLLLLVGLRYGVPAATSTALVVSTVAVGVALGQPGLAPMTPVLQRQMIGILLITVATTLLLLWRRQQEAVARLSEARAVTDAFLTHAEPLWYVKSYPDGVATYDRIGGGALRGKTWSQVTDAELFGQQAGEGIDRADRAVLDSGEPSVAFEHMPAPGGEMLTYLAHRFPITDSSGATIAVGGIRMDVTEQQTQTELLEKQASLLEAMFDLSPVPTMRVHFRSGEAVIAQANRALGTILGRSASELIGQSPREAVVATDWPALAALFGRHPRGRGPRWSPQAEVRVHTRIGGDRTVLVTVAPLRLDTEEEYLVHLEDVTARRAAEEAVTRYSMIDSATGVLNRRALGDRLDAALHRLAGSDAGVALIVIDVDDFKSVNDAMGHAAGDQLLAEFASRLRATCGSGTGIARLGADEFAIVSEWTQQEDAALLVGRLQSILTEPIVFRGEEFSRTATFGVALTTDEDMSAGELVRRAELALFRAKNVGRNRVEFYSESLRTQAQTTLNIRRELSRAIADDSFLVVYQPIVELADGHVRDFEALVRLPTIDGRILAPGAFLDVARSSDMLAAIDRLVLNRCLTDLAEGRLPAPTANVSINCESEELEDPDFAMRILQSLHATGVDPARVTLEVTERALLDLDDLVLENVRSLRSAGVSFAIDDFGTGYSSLAQLRNLTVDVLKIDRSFVIEMENDKEAANIVAAVIALAHSLGLVALAEGIETRGQAESLRRLGCDRGQGYLFGKPVPPPSTVVDAPLPEDLPSRGN